MDREPCTGGSPRAVLAKAGRRGLTEDEKKIEAFIRKKGVTKCPPCFSEEFKRMNIEKASNPLSSSWGVRKINPAPANKQPATKSKRGKNNWDEERHDLKRLIAAGWHYDQLASHFRVSKSRIGQQIKRFGLDTPKRRGFSDEDIALMFIMKSRGQKYDEVGKEFGVCGVTIRNAIMTDSLADGGAVYRPKVLVKNPTWDFSNENLD